MPYIRSELTRGIGVLCIFLGLIVATGILLPFPISQFEYVSVDIRLAMDNPETFYRQNITSTATVSTSLTYLHPNYFVGTSEGVFLFFHHEHHPLESAEIAPGDRIYFRGTVINNSVSVHEFYIIDQSSSIIRSIPGIILFAVMFFSIFKIDFKRLVFVSKKGGGEST